jgi:hypothetical protein
MSVWRRGVLAAVGLGSIITAAVGVAVGTSVHVLATSTPGYNTVNVGAYGGEPSIVSDSLGQLYDSTPSGGTLTYTSTNHGRSWAPVTTADPRSGDDCLATDQANSVYLCNLNVIAGTSTLQADVFKSTNQGKTWTKGTTPSVPACGSTSCSPFGVDRPWVAASIPAGGTTKTAEVVLMYHDFFGPSQIWVNISHDGTVLQKV